MEVTSLLVVMPFYENTTAVIEFSPKKKKEALPKNIAAIVNFWHTRILSASLSIRVVADKIL